GRRAGPGDGGGEPRPAQPGDRQAGPERSPRGPVDRLGHRHPHPAGVPVGRAAAGPDAEEYRGRGPGDGGQDHRARFDRRARHRGSRDGAADGRASTFRGAGAADRGPVHGGGEDRRGGAGGQEGRRGQGQGREPGSADGHRVTGRGRPGVREPAASADRRGGGDDRGNDRGGPGGQGGRQASAPDGIHRGDRPRADHAQGGHDGGPGGRPVARGRGRTGRRQR